VSKQKTKLKAHKKDEAGLLNKLDTFFLVGKGAKRHPEMEGQKIKKIILKEKIKI
jgi:hypothetical protein